MSLGTQIVWLFVLAIPVACISWTFTHEELFHELHKYLVKRTEKSRSLPLKKFFYVFTCEYCFSHYVVAVLLAITNYQLLYPDWKGYLISGFSLVWIANIYMSLYALLRTDLKKERAEAKLEEEKLKE